MKKNMIFITVALSSFLCLWQCSTQKTVPEELAGIWKAKNPDYQGTFLGLRDSTITFGTVTGDVQNFSILKIKKTKVQGDWESIVIHYLDNNLKRYELPIYYHPMNDGILRFQNKEEITWFREKS
ncbi:MAG: hypothetical protein PVH84_12610 [Candidatus Aminicenantes bacterium]|jgi:hypothetical protein